MNGSMHTVKAGENMARIAKVFGFRDWQRIYRAPENAELRRLRPDPELLSPGDRVFVPFRESRWQTCETNAAHTFVLASPVHRVRLHLIDAGGQAMVGAEYELTAGEATYFGVVPSSGIIEHTVELEVETATLRLRAPVGDNQEPCELVLSCKLGHLEPIEQPRGVQARLTNLGFYEGEIDGQMTPETEAAITRLRAAAELEPDATVDDAVRRELLERAGV